jgi:hypothetical protein
MRRVSEPITPKFRPGKEIPRWFRWRNETYELCRLIETWTKASEWWRHTGPERRVFYRVEVRGAHPTDVWRQFTCTIRHRTHGERSNWQMVSVDD